MSEGVQSVSEFLSELNKYNLLQVYISDVIDFGVYSKLLYTLKM